MTTIVKVDTRGNFRLPPEVKVQAGIGAHDELLVTLAKGTITIKKIEPSKASDRFKRLSEKTRKGFATAKVTAEHVSEAVQWARRK